MATTTLTIADNKIAKAAKSLADHIARPDGLNDGQYVKYAVVEWLNEIVHKKKLKAEIDVKRTEIEVIRQQARTDIVI